MVHCTPRRPVSRLAPLAIFGLTSLLFLPGGVVAQESDTATHDVTITVSEIAELRIFGGDAPSFTVGAVAPTAGAAPAIVASNADGSFLQYTSVVAAPFGEADSRTISVSRSDDLPAGLTLRLRVTLPGAGKTGNTGVVGDFNGDAAITAITGDASQDAVRAIGTGWTGTAAGDGARLTYSLIITELFEADLFAFDGRITVTYTLTEGS